MRQQKLLTVLLLSEVYFFIFAFHRVRCWRNTFILHHLLDLPSCFSAVVRLVGCCMHFQRLYGICVNLRSYSKVIYVKKKKKEIALFKKEKN